MHHFGSLCCFKGAFSRQRLTHWIGAMRFSLALENHKEEKGRQNDVEQSGGKGWAEWEWIESTHFSMVPKSHLGSLLKGILIRWNLAIFSATSAEMLGSLNSSVSSLRLWWQMIYLKLFEALLMPPKCSMLLKVQSVKFGLIYVFILVKAWHTAHT